eukprot:3208733-Amphidinium_carterae.1
MLCFAKRGQPMRAFHSIGSPGIKKPDEHTVNTLTNLLGCKDLEHPQAWLHHLEDHSVPARLLPGLDKAILRLKRGKSTDQHGWSAEAARILLVDPLLWQAMQRWLSHLALQETCVPLLHALHSCKCIPLAKPQGGIRPILIPSLWAKVLAGTLLQLQQQ